MTKRSITCILRRIATLKVAARTELIAYYMPENLISSVYLNGTSTPLETGERIYSIQLSSPFLDFLTIAIIFSIAFFVFKLIFIDIWKD